MIAINFSTARGRLKDFCDRVTDRGETVIVTRKAEKNVVIISEERFNELEKPDLTRRWRRRSRRPERTRISLQN